MGWEQRNGRSYYYYKRREGGRVVSQYGGSGEIAAAIATLQDADNSRRNWQRELDRMERDEQRAIDTELDQVGAMVRAATAAALTEAGYYQHKGQWRKRQ